MDGKQHERQERGDEFQDEIRRSWAHVPNCWRMRIPDGGGATRPADELILLEDANVLVEHKRTEEDRFKLSFLRTDQAKGLLKFSLALKRNRGLIFVSFQNFAEDRDIAYAFDIERGLRFMQHKSRKYITMTELATHPAWSLKLQILDSKERVFDLKGVNAWCKYW